MRTLIGTSDDLREIYSAPARPWLRVNMVSTVDGAANGESGLSGSINNAADKIVYDLLRDLADAIIVGAGTARMEGYRPTTKPTVVVTRGGVVPQRLKGGPAGSVLLATVADAPGLAMAVDELGDDNVFVLGEEKVDLALLKAILVERGLTTLLCEGGPHLLRDLLDQGVVDEVCCTFVPRLLAGQHPRITDGPGIDVPLRLATLVEHDGTLLGRWLTDATRLHP